MPEENPYRSPHADSPPAEETPAEPDKLSGMGCLVLWIVLPFLDLCAVILSRGPYQTAMLILGLVGFAAGAGLGGYVSVRVLHKPWWSSGRFAIYGLVGTCLFVLISYAILVGRLP